MNTQTLAPFALTAEQVAIINARPEAPDTVHELVEQGHSMGVCLRCYAITYNKPVVDDVLCDICTWGAVRAFAAGAAETAALAAAEHARIRAERDAEMSALIKAEAARRGLPPGRFTYMSC